MKMQQNTQFMKTILHTLWMITLGLATQAQTTIKGKVKDNKGRPIPGASISIKDSYDGTTSDSTGYYKFQTTDKDSQVVMITVVGYKSFEKKYKLVDKAELVIDANLKETLNELKAVVVTAGSFSAGGKRNAISLSPLDIVTTAGSNADIVTALRAVPGTQQVGESEGLFVRGGTAQETKIFIDGNVVPNFFGSSVPDIAQRGRFSPFLFKGTAFSTGGYSALYGQALSSALLLETIDLPEQSSAALGVSPIFASAGLQNLAKDKKSSWGFNYSYTNLALYFGLVAQKPDYFTVPHFHAMDANYRIRLNNGGMLKYYAQFNAGNLGLRNPSLDSTGLKNAFGLTNYNFYNNLSVKLFAGNGWRFNGAVSYTNNSDNINTEIQNQQNNKVPVTSINSIDYGSFDLKQKTQFAQARGVFEKKIGVLDYIRFGTEYWYAYDDRTFTNLSGSFNQKLKENYASAFGEADIFITNEIALKAGVRLEYSDLINKWNVAPRFSAAYKFSTKAQMNFDYGMFYQTPENRYLGNAQNVNLGYTRADHYIITYNNISENYTFRTQLYYKNYVNLLKTDNGGLNATGVNGSGYAQGFELFWRDKKTIKGMDYWVTYSYLDTKRNFLNYPITAQPTFAANHVASIVLKKFWAGPSFGINLSYTYSTGRPYRDPNKPDNEFLSDRTIAFQNFNMSVNWLTKIGKAFTVVFFSMNNVLNQKQVFSYNYSNRIRDVNNNLTRAEVGPQAPQFFFLGMFLSWGIDRRNEEVNKGL
jgi:vitamin B12 transporter